MITARHMGTHELTLHDVGHGRNGHAIRSLSDVVALQMQIRTALGIADRHVETEMRPNTLGFQEQVDQHAHSRGRSMRARKGLEGIRRGRIGKGAWHSREWHGKA